MSTSGRNQASQDAFMRPTPTETRSQSPLKRPREDSPPGSESDAEEPDDNRMDFEHAEHITSTQAIGDDNTDGDHELPQLAPPLSPEQTALRADFEIITAAAMERLYHRITKDINKTTALAVEKATGPLENRIVSMGTRIAQLQQQVLTYQQDIQRTLETPAAAPTSGKKDQKKKKEKQMTNQANANTHGNTNPTYAAVAAALPTFPPSATATHTPGWPHVHHEC